MGKKYTFSSVSEKPRPVRMRRLYLIVGQRTIGFSLSTGRGATAAALARRAFRRRCLRPGCSRSQLRLSLREVRFSRYVPDRSGSELVVASPCGSLFSS